MVREEPPLFGYPTFALSVSQAAKLRKAAAAAIVDPNIGLRLSQDQLRPRGHEGAIGFRMLYPEAMRMKEAWSRGKSYMLRFNHGTARTQGYYMEGQKRWKKEKERREEKKGRDERKRKEEEERKIRMEEGRKIRMEEERKRKEPGHPKRRGRVWAVGGVGRGTKKATLLGENEWKTM